MGVAPLNKGACVTATKQQERVFFTQGDQALPVPDLTAHQRDSWNDFVQNGLREVFDEVSPIDDYTGQKLSLRFKDYAFREPTMTEREAKYNLATYEAALHVNVEITNKVTGTVKEQDIYFGSYPWMTDRYGACDCLATDSLGWGVLLSHRDGGASLL